MFVCVFVLFLLIVTLLLFGFAWVSRAYLVMVGGVALIRLSCSASLAVHFDSGTDVCLPECFF
jgi:hypothetical protein